MVSVLLCGMFAQQCLRMIFQGLFSLEERIPLLTQVHN